MKSKSKIFIALAFTLIISVSFSIPVSSQSWYSDFLNIDKSEVAGASTSRGKPETPGSQSTNRQDTGRSNSNSEAQTNANETESESDESTTPTFLRRNTFSNLQEMKDLSPDERQERISELRSAAKAERCEVIEENINRRLDYYQNSQTDHVRRYQGILVGLNKAAERLSLLGYDTTDLESKIEQLQVQINEMNVMHNDLIAALQSVKTAQCSDEETDPNTKGMLAKTTVQEIRAKALSIKEYIRNEIIPTLQALKNQDPDPVSQPAE